ncbi:MAG: hypothetical protein ACOY4T_05930, partial [Pseudomonadota bacterium]
MGRSSTAKAPQKRDADTKLAQSRLSVLDLARELGNVAYHRPFWMTHEGGFPSPSSSDSILFEGMEDGMAGIAVTRVDPTAAELRRASGKTKVGQDEGRARRR